MRIMLVGPLFTGLHKEKTQRNGIDVAHTHEDFGPLLVSSIQELNAIP